MKTMFNKILALVLTVLMSTGLFIITPVEAEITEDDQALMMMAAAHARINGINDREQLKNMADGYYDIYDDMLSSPELDDEQKARILEIRENKLDLIDDKIDDLEEAWRAKRRSWSPIGIARGLVKGGEAVLGKGVEAALRTIKDPRKLVLTTLAVVATGGASSIKDVGFKILKSEFTRAGKRAAYAEIAKRALNGTNFGNALKLIDALGIKLSPEVRQALEDNTKEQDEENDGGDEESLEEGDEDEEDDGGVDIGPEGEGGYDDEEDDPADDPEEVITGEAPTLWQVLNASFSMTYTVESYDMVIWTDEADTIELLNEIRAKNLAKVGVLVIDTGAFTFSDAGNNVLGFNGSDELAKELEFAIFPKSGTYNNGVILESGTSSIVFGETTDYCHYSIDIRFYIEGDYIIMDGSITNNYPMTKHESTETISFNGMSPIPIPAD